MSSGADNDWKKNLGFPINYDSGQSTDEDLDTKDVVMRHPQQSSKYLLAENGDGSEADLLGTTPPRARIRDKEKRRNIFDSGLYKPLVEGKSVIEPPLPPERFKKRTSLKLIRTKERDWKDGQRETRADSLPSPSPQAAVPTLVESCNRFMSLTSRLKCKEECEEVQERHQDDELPASRVDFHSTFSMLINMGNIDKGCRRTISHEEQVWQNELKDLIWLELKAKLAGRTLAAQDEELCVRRSLVSGIVQRIKEYRFENPTPCRHRARRLATIDDSAEDPQKTGSDEVVTENEEDFICICIDCTACTASVGAAMKQVASLLEAVDSAVELYPSSCAAAADHPALFEPEVTNRLKAMCLWYNTALHMRLKVMSVRRMLRYVREKTRRHYSVASNRKSSVAQRTSQVRFNVSTSPSDSNNSDASGNSDSRPEKHADGDADKDRSEKDEAEKGTDVVDSGYGRSDADTPEVVVSDPYSTTDTTVSSESGYTSEAEDPSDVFELGGLQDVAQLRLMGRTDVSAYRDYHYEMLKTQGVRRCMTFMNKMCNKLLNKVYLTLMDPQEPDGEHHKHQASDKNNYEFRRYGCWSEETLSMKLPSYRNHFLLLTTISMEAVHDYLTMRLEGRPDHPSCLTVKQLIHELKEGLDIAAETRASFARNVQAALRNARVAERARGELAHVLHTFDNTVETALQQYLSYLSKMSETEPLSRARLSSEWSFTSRLAARAPPAAYLAPPAFADMACNQLKRVLNRFEEKFHQVMDIEQSEHSEAEERYLVYALCRETQTIYSSEREAALQAAQWARSLAAKIAHTHRQHSDRIFECLMAIRDCLVRHTDIILEKSKPLTLEMPKDMRESLGGRVRELLLQVYKLGFELHMELHRFATPARPVPRRPVSLQPVPPSRPPPAATRPGTVLINTHMMHKELYRFVNETPQKTPTKGTSCSPRNIRFVRSESIGEEAEQPADDQAVMPSTDIEALLSGPRGPESPVLRRRAPSPPRSDCKRVARAVIEFAKCWMKFVVERCDRGRGLRPRWASQGLEFLMLACDPCNTKHLTDEEFEDLKQLMDGCISHVIGSRAASSPAPPRARHRLHSPLPPCPATSPPSERDAPLLLHRLDDNVYSKRILEAVQHLDESRDEKLRSAKAVGRALESTVRSYEPKLRQLTFKWQRGLKIGAGTFGKVYTVVNTESGQVLAMKELSVGAGDRRALQRAANELRVLEGAVHPHLVRYYGCELHREEMLIFMELCVEGSLEALVATSGPLAEHTTRRYTKQLVSAVSELHSRSIAHRDIKSGNIFLTNEGHCLKLGDFGCAVKIRANTTAPGELQGFVGTQAYMAPEVFMKSSGHGRAADIWSLGCVVTEMASGKRPFSEYDSNYQIMFVVGMGGRPHIPDTLSEEGQMFCVSCLTHDPDQRPRAEALSLHHFLMVKSDDDYKCDPAYLMT
ncbi:uncharacterized protein LOC116769290 isoform X2 [Danaus plexippus]|uniref:uncharacterized protein LOC116769290 isoform X2 n=1 Tax=Danaus plexippus TaxID=13037 RepID=UPI002AAF71A4|nr:uncharacterized protein LOC116769290 isoform X2 [Danaus plexippus]